MNIPLFVNSQAKESVVVMLEAGSWKISSNTPALELYIENAFHSTLKHNDIFTLLSDSRIQLKHKETPLSKTSASILKWDSQVPS